MSHLLGMHRMEPKYHVPYVPVDGAIAYTQSKGADATRGSMRSVHSFALAAAFAGCSEWAHERWTVAARTAVSDIGDTLLYRLGAVSLVRLLLDAKGGAYDLGSHMQWALTIDTPQRNAPASRDDLFAAAAPRLSELHVVVLLPLISAHVLSQADAHLSMRAYAHRTLVEAGVAVVIARSVHAGGARRSYAATHAVANVLYLLTHVGRDLARTLGEGAHARLTDAHVRAVAERVAWNCTDDYDARVALAGAAADTREVGLACTAIAAYVHRVTPVRAAQGMTEDAHACPIATPMLPYESVVHVAGATTGNPTPVVPISVCGAAEMIGSYSAYDAFARAVKTVHTYVRSGYTSVDLTAGTDMRTLTVPLCKRRDALETSMSDRPPTGVASALYVPGVVHTIVLPLHAEIAEHTRRSCSNAFASPGSVRRTACAPTTLRIHCINDVDGTIVSSHDLVRMRPDTAAPCGIRPVTLPPGAQGSTEVYFGAFYRHGWGSYDACVKWACMYTHIVADAHAGGAMGCVRAAYVLDMIDGVWAKLGLVHFGPADNAWRTGDALDGASVNACFPPIMPGWLDELGVSADAWNAHCDVVALRPVPAAVASSRDSPLVNMARHLMAFVGAEQHAHLYTRTHCLVPPYGALGGGLFVACVEYVADALLRIVKTQRMASVGGPHALTKLSVTVARHYDVPVALLQTPQAMLLHTKRTTEDAMNTGAFTLDSLDDRERTIYATLAIDAVGIQLDAASKRAVQHAAVNDVVAMAGALRDDGDRPLVASTAQLRALASQFTPAAWEPLVKAARASTVCDARAAMLIGTFAVLGMKVLRCTNYRRIKNTPLHELFALRAPPYATNMAYVFHPTLANTNDAQASFRTWVDVSRAAADLAPRHKTRGEALFAIACEVVALADVYFVGILEHSRPAKALGADVRKLMRAATGVARGARGVGAVGARDVVRALREAEAGAPHTRAAVGLLRLCAAFCMYVSETRGPDERIVRVHAGTHGNAPDWRQLSVCVFRALAVMADATYMSTHAMTPVESALVGHIVKWSHASPHCVVARSAALCPVLPGFATSDWHTHYRRDTCTLDAFRRMSMATYTTMVAYEHEVMLGMLARGNPERGFQSHATAYTAARAEHWDAIPDCFNNTVTQAHDLARLVSTRAPNGDVYLVVPDVWEPAPALHKRGAGTSCAPGAFSVPSHDETTASYVALLMGQLHVNRAQLPDTHARDEPGAGTPRPPSPRRAAKKKPGKAPPPKKKTRKIVVVPLHDDTGDASVSISRDTDDTRALLVRTVHPAADASLDVMHLQPHAAEAPELVLSEDEDEQGASAGVPTAAGDASPHVLSLQPHAAEAPELVMSEDEQATPGAGVRVVVTPADEASVATRQGGGGGGGGGDDGWKPVVTDESEQSETPAQQDAGPAWSAVTLYADERMDTETTAEAIVTSIVSDVRALDDPHTCESEQPRQQTIQFATPESDDSDSDDAPAHRRGGTRVHAQSLSESDDDDDASAAAPVAVMAEDTPTDTGTESAGPPPPSPSPAPAPSPSPPPSPSPSPAPAPSPSPPPALYQDRQAEETPDAESVPASGVLDVEHMGEGDMWMHDGSFTPSPQDEPQYHFS